jgi:rod shape determining protein RodA
VTPLFRKFLGLHWILFAAMAAMIAIGVYSVYAAVHFRTEAAFSSRWNDQIRWVLIGSVFFFATSLIDYKWVRWASLPLYLTGLGLLVLQGIKGKEVYGSMLSLSIAGVSFQASQFAITATILLLAVVLGEAHKYIPWLRHYMVRFLLAGAIFALPFLIVVKQGDLGSAMVMVPIVAAMLLVGNIPFRCLISVSLIGLIVMPPVYFFALKTYQRDRIQVTIDLLMNRPVDTKGAGWNASNLLIAVGSSGWEGKGLEAKDMLPGQKSMLHLGLTSKYTAHTDFIFASAAETFGFRGGAIMIIGFIFITTMTLMISFFSRDQLGRLITVGIVALLFAHIFEHIGMNMVMLPITGIPLPLISYGGTFMVMNLFLFGLIQSVWIHRNAMVEEEKAKAKTARGGRSVAAYP